MSKAFSKHIASLARYANYEPLTSSDRDLLTSYLPDSPGLIVAPGRIVGSHESVLHDPYICPYYGSWYEHITPEDLPQVQADANLWEALSSNYKQFINDADAYRTFRKILSFLHSDVGPTNWTPSGWLAVRKVSCKPPQAKWVNYSAVGKGKSVHPKANVKPPELAAELIKYGEERSECWIQIAPGMRIRTLVPTEPLRSLALRPGDEFRWSTGQQRALPAEHDTIRQAEIQAQLDELDREFFEELADPPASAHD